MSEPTLRQLRTFLAIVASGSVSVAARSLGITQPAASQQMRELERHMGVRLLERAAGLAKPTAAGEALLAPARRALAAADDATAAVAAHRSGEAGKVRLGTGATACIYLLPPALAAVRKRMPGLQLSVAMGNTDDMVRQVEDGTLDVALVTLPVPRIRSLAVTRLLTDPMMAVVPKHEAARFSEPVGAADLAQLPLILFEAGANVRSLVEGWYGAEGRPAKPAMELGNVEAIKALVAGGLGCSILPGSAIASGMRGAVAFALRPALKRNLAIVLRKEKIVDRGLRTVLDALLELSKPPLKR
ncbi:LysR family transcriptional regulator [Sabulicella glaciei]|uniref:LysR family transcriptional regulator n=1 Tax=Sabulicella glaciei TaxID=2984948 RepID=A0ABT3P018_9PROT|nr:LysR family transcriptional regulator [Roseococcus sp. MDT2-1-1]MCW8087518.1 LysR family transcriptional regulator [Roseococcus sp. MDT2-1-1]